MRRITVDGVITRALLAQAVVISAGMIPARAQTITTLAGNGAAAFAGDGGAATSASLNGPKGLAVSSGGTVYIADMSNFRVRAVSPQGTISTVAGNGSDGYSGDGAAAASAAFADVSAVALDNSGNLYIADSSNRRLRKVSTNGIVTTIAGTGIEGFSGDGGPAASAQLGRPTGLAFDSAGNLYITDSSEQRVRKISTSGIITTVAGNGVAAFSGDGGQATSASINFPLGIAVDNSGNIYIADAGNNRVRKVTPTGIITTIAGTGSGAFSGDGGPAASAGLNLPSDLAFDSSGNLYVADAGNNRVRKIDTTGTITTIAGIATNGFAGDNGPATSATLNHPWGLAIGGNGSIYIADDLNNRVRAIAAPPLSPPTIPANSAVNGASFAAGQAVSAGSVVTVFGSSLATGTIQATSTPLPTSLGTTSVTVNGVAAPLYYVSSGQIDIQVPFNVPNGAANIQVTRGSSSSAVQAMNVATTSPGIFMNPFAQGQGIVLHAADFSLVTSSSPAHPGEYLSIYTTGLGPVTGNPTAGSPAPGVTAGSPLSYTTITPTASIGNVQSFVSFSGLAPGWIGIYQVNIQVPANLPAGNQTLVISSNGVASNPVTVPVSQ